MKTLEKVSDFVGKYMAAIVIVVAAGALFFPGPFSVVKTAWVNNLLGIVMFGMGLTLKPEDFKVCLLYTSHHTARRTSAACGPG